MEQKPFSLTKTAVECYKIRQQGGLLWADIVVDASESAGRIQIASDYGSWEKYWGSGTVWDCRNCGGNGFKKFLTGLDIHYAAGKFGEGRWFNQEATINGLKKSVKEYDGTKREKGVMVNEIASLEYCMNQNTFIHMAYDCKTLHKLWDSGPDIETGISPSFLNFWEKLWPVFIDELKKEVG